jgi:hypothetical protein
MGAAVRYYEDRLPFLPIRADGQEVEEAAVVLQDDEVFAEPVEDTVPLAQPQAAVTLVVPDNVMVIPRAPQTVAELKRARRRSRLVHVKSIIVSLILLIVLTLVINVIWQVITHPELSPLDWAMRFGLMKQ